MDGAVVAFWKLSPVSISGQAALAQLAQRTVHASPRFADEMDVRRGFLARFRSYRGMIYLRVCGLHRSQSLRHPIRGRKLSA